jgi:Trk-type K+ transport system membrane component
MARLVRAVVLIAGRLEFYTLVVILTPTFWRQ